MARTFSFLKRTSSGVTVSLRVKPRARRAVLELAADQLNATVNAPPVDGKANDAVVALLAKTWHVPKSSVGIVGGLASRSKTVAIAGDPVEIARGITDWAEARG